MREAITFRPATRQDAVAILRLEKACMRGYAEALWGCWYPSQTAATLDLRGFEMIEAEGLFVGCVACEWHSDHLRLQKTLYSARVSRARDRRNGLGLQAEGGGGQRYADTADGPEQQSRRQALL
jgi:hypothetical protein